MHIRILLPYLPIRQYIMFTGHVSDENDILTEGHRHRTDRRDVSWETKLSDFRVFSYTNNFNCNLNVNNI